MAGGQAGRGRDAGGFCSRSKQAQPLGGGGRPCISGPRDVGTAGWLQPAGPDRLDSGTEASPRLGGDVATFQGHGTMTGLETPGLDCETGPFKVWSPWHSGYKKLGRGS